MSHAALPQGHPATLAAHRPHGGAGGPKGPCSNPRNPLQGSQVCTGICPLYLSGTGLTCLCLPLPIPPIAYFVTTSQQSLQPLQPLDGLRHNGRTVAVAPSWLAGGSGREPVLYSELDYDGCAIYSRGRSCKLFWVRLLIRSVNRNKQDKSVVACAYSTSCQCARSRKLSHTRCIDLRMDPPKPPTKRYDWAYLFLGPMLLSTFRTSTKKKTPRQPSRKSPPLVPILPPTIAHGQEARPGPFEDLRKSRREQARELGRIKESCDPRGHYGGGRIKRAAALKGP